MPVSFIGGGNRTTRRIPPTCRKSDNLYHIVLWVVYQHGQSHISGGATMRCYRKRPWPEVTLVTWPEMTVTGSDVIFPCFFLTIVVVQNVPLHMTGRNITTAYRRSRDRKWRHRNKSGSVWFPLGCFWICSRLLCSTPSSLPRFFGAFLLYLQRSFNVLFINCSFLLFFFVNFLSITTFLDSFL